MASDPSDRDLLFGIQALQSGLIEPADLAAALRCWLQDNDRSVARILMERGSLSREEAALVEDLIRLHAGNQAGDAQPEQPAGVNADEPCEPAMSSAAVKEGPESPYPAFAVADLQAVESAGDLTVGFAAQGAGGSRPRGASWWGGQRRREGAFASCGCTRGAASATSSWLAIPSCTARSPSSRFSPSTPTTRPAALAS